MDARLRLAPALAVAVLFAIKTFRPDFLAAHVTESVPVSWFWIVTLPLMYLAAYLLTPPFVRLVNTTARVAFIPAAVFLALAIGALWTIDVLWNHTLHAWFPTLPESHILPSLTAAVFGGP